VGLLGNVTDTGLEAGKIFDDTSALKADLPLARSSSPMIIFTVVLFPAPVGADVTKDLAGSQGEADVLDHGDAIEPLWSTNKLQASDLLFP